MPLEGDQNSLRQSTKGTSGSTPTAGDSTEFSNVSNGDQPGEDARAVVAPTQVFDSLAHANQSTREDGRAGPDLDGGADVQAETPTVTAPYISPTSPDRFNDNVRKVGPYLLIERLGSGSQGEVWRALQFEPIRRTVALKLLRHHLTLNTDAAERMRKEAERGGKLNHETILPVLDFGLEGDLAYFAMPLVDGFTLSQVISTRTAWLANKMPADLPRRAILPEPAYLKAMAHLLGRVSRALAHAHDARIIHRDIKPTNILIDRANDERIFLADFGLARDLDNMTTDSFSEPGTLLYMAPERLRGQGSYDDRRADIFSMGVTLFEAVTLKRAFHVPSDLPRTSWPSYLVGQPTPSPRTMSPHLPRDLAAVIEKAMDPNPSLRYESASALADDLDNFVEGRPVKARPPGRLRRAWRWLLVHKTAKLVLGVVIALLVAGVVFLLFDQIKRAQSRASFAEAERFAERSQLHEALVAFDRGRLLGPEDARVGAVIASAMRIEILELADGGDSQSLVEILELYRNFSRHGPSRSDDLVRRLKLRNLELVANGSSVTVLVHPIRANGRPRLDRPILKGTITDPGSPLALRHMIPGRYWVTAIARDGKAFDEQMILVPTSRKALDDSPFRVVLSPRSGPPPSMVWINGGEFRMGRDLVPEADGRSGPLYPDMPSAGVVVPAFYLDATEVTIAEFAEFLKADNHQDWASDIWPERGHPEKNQSSWPVTHVTYEQALAYATWRGCRLPTEHELEFAARAFDNRILPPDLDGNPSAPGSSWLKLHAVTAEPRDVSRARTSMIHGLFGNAGELTLFHYRPYPSLHLLRARSDAWNGIAVRSGLISGGEILPTAPRLLGYLGRASQLPGQASVHVGFRCARSVRPWTETGPPHFTIQE